MVKLLIGKKEPRNFGGVILEKEKVKNISFSKSGKGNLTPRIIIPIEWVRDMGIPENSDEEKKVILRYDSKGKKITLEKYKG